MAQYNHSDLQTKLAGMTTLCSISGAQGCDVAGQVREAVGAENNVTASPAPQTAESGFGAMISVPPKGM